MSFKVNFEGHRDQRHDACRLLRPFHTFRDPGKPSAPVWFIGNCSYDYHSFFLRRIVLCILPLQCSFPRGFKRHWVETLTLLQAVMDRRLSCTAHMWFVDLVASE